MIKYFCERCGEEIKNLSERKVINFGYDSDGMSIPEDYCLECHNKIKEFANERKI